MHFVAYGNSLPAPVSNRPGTPDESLMIGGQPAAFAVPIVPAIVS